jgi:hypothetical protein
MRCSPASQTSLISSFVQDCTCFAGYVIVTLDIVTEACLLLVGTTVQKADLIALTQVLQGTH